MAGHETFHEVVRLGDKLWVYPGDGYARARLRRVEILPAGQRTQSRLPHAQIVSAGPPTGDRRTDFFATVGEELAFTGYNGATIDKAIRLSATRAPMTSSPCTGRQRRRV
ncbi:hypothetical protein SALBM217S_01001 [Streptomyces griseoloalbus]